MTGRELSQYLRHGTDANLRRRRGVVGLSLLSAATMGFISLYQMGLMNHLPELPFRRFDAERISGSGHAYSHLKMPDGLLGFLSYGMTAALAATGGRAREKRLPLLPLAMAGKAVIDAATAIKLTRTEVAHYRTFCLYCFIATLATLGVLPLVWPEARQALRHLLQSPVSSHRSPTDPDMNHRSQQGVSIPPEQEAHI